MGDERTKRLALGAWLALLAATLTLAAWNASAAPEKHRNLPTTWEQYGSGQTGGLAVGAYPLPPTPERRDAEVKLVDGAKERWLRRHYQWLRALNELVRQPEEGHPRHADPEAQRALSPATRPGSMRLGDMTVLHGGHGAYRIAPHLLDDGARDEDPPAGPGDGEVIDYLVSDRLAIESAKFVAEHFGPMARSVRAALDGDEFTHPEFSRALRYDRPSPNAWFAAPRDSGAHSSASPDRSNERVTMIAFFKAIILDILSAPTTYLLTLFVLLGWAILRATVFARN